MSKKVGPESFELSPEFELVQVHENGNNAEIVVRDKNSLKVFAGNLNIMSDPEKYYPPDYFEEDDE